MCKQDFLYAVFVSHFLWRCDKYNVIVKDMEYQQCLFLGWLKQDSPNEVFCTNLTHWYMGQKFWHRSLSIPGKFRSTNCVRVQKTSLNRRKLQGKPQPADS